MNVLVAGGSGFIGIPLVDALLQRGDHVTVVSRDPPRAREYGRPAATYRGWLPPVDAYDGVVNLAGESIFGQRWSPAFQQRLADSRILTTRRIVNSFAQAQDPPGVLVNASAVGYYGDRGEVLLDESSPAGDDFLARVCQEWEGEAARAPGRVVQLRFGIVLGPGGGALAAMLGPFRFGLGGPIGNGRQYFSWIHIHDVVGLILHALDHDTLQGPVNVTAPRPVSNKAFSRALGRSLRRPAVLPTPRWALRLALGKVASILVSSQRCSPQAAQKAGYTFRFTDLPVALADVLGR